METRNALSKYIFNPILGFCPRFPHKKHVFSNEKHKHHIVLFNSLCSVELKLLLILINLIRLHWLRKTFRNFIMFLNYFHSLSIFFISLGRQELFFFISLLGSLLRSHLGGNKMKIRTYSWNWWWEIGLDVNFYTHANTQRASDRIRINFDGADQKDWLEF